MKTIINKLILIFIFAITFLNANATIKIVYNGGTPPLKFTDANNKPNGMIIDIWKLWAKKTNQKIEFIETSWDNTIDMIKEGTANIHAGIYYTKQRDEFLDYTSKPFYTNKKYFFYHKSLGDIFSINDLKPYVIAIDNGYPKMYMEENLSNFFWKEFKSADDANSAFFNNRYKVVLSSLSTFYYYLKRNNIDENLYKYNESTYAYSKNYYGAVKQGNKKLLDLIEEGFSKISDEEINQIELKWTKELNFNDFDNTTSEILFTKDEISYLNHKKELTMCVDPAWLPFEQLEENQYKGIIADIYKLFNKNLIVPIRLVPTQSWSESLASSKLRKCDLLSAVAKTVNREKYMNFSKPFMTFSQVLVTREKEPFIIEFDEVIYKKIGVVRDSAIAELLQHRYPNINLVEVESILDGLFKVSSGELYGFVNTTAAVSYAIAKSGMTNLKIASKVGIDYQIRVALRNDEPLLVDIFNKIIDKTSKEEINNIKDKWLKVKVDENVDYTLVYKILGWFIVIIIVIFYWNRKLKQEIDVRVKAEKELNKFLQIIEQSQASIILTDLEGKILYVNPHSSKETGYTKEELIGNTPSVFKSGSQSKEFYDELWDTIKSGNTWQGEFLNKKKNGDHFWESAVIAPIFDEDKNIKFFASIKQDITDRVKVQEELIIAQKEANEANEAKSDFLAKMSHEIRTPMNAVLGMMYLLEKTNLTNDQRNYLKKANIAANSLLGIINDILDFSKIEANKMEIKNSEFNIYELINDIMSVMSDKAEDKNIELITKFDDKIPVYIISDRLRLAQILNNLISNAIKFTDAGEVIVSANLSKNESSKKVILNFCVKDTGIGISKENQKHLFNEFVQVDNSATRSFYGTGLGLAICKKLSNMLGGDIWIESSNEGLGTTICFSIEVKIAVSQEHVGFLFPSDSKNLKVLVVDDNNLAADVLTHILESFTYEVKSVNSGYEAIKILKEERFDLVFLDYKMPNLNGLDTFNKYKNILKEKTPKTIIVTAYSGEVLQKDVEKLGIFGFLQKPITPSTLHDKIIEIFDTSTNNPDPKNRNINKIFEPQNVLLVEDNELNREFAISVLEDFGLNVDVAVDGIEAIQKVITQKYKLVLMDIQMPKLDGLEATQKIRSLNEKYFKTLPIIALSANALVGDRQKSIDAGMNEHITKPINPNTLYLVLKKYIPEKTIIKDEDINKKPNYKYIKQLNENLFDINEAMNRISYNEELYIKILKQFKNNYQNMPDEMDRLLKDNELEKLEKKIHEMKGIVGNIAAKKLFDLLSTINGKLINKGIINIELIEEFKEEFNNIITDINKLELIEFEEIKQFDKDIVLKLLNSLDKTIDYDIVEATKILEELGHYLQKSDYKDIYTKMDEALNSFDTDKLKQLIKNFFKEL
jgi:PAS domain S-box-containing protein